MHTFKVHWSAWKNGQLHRSKTLVTAKNPDSAREQMLLALKKEDYTSPLIQKIKA